MNLIDDISFGPAFHGVGWYEMEGAELAYYRWMKSGEVASINLITDRMRAVNVSCEIVGVVCDEVFEYLTISVDQNNIEFAVTDINGKINLEFIIPNLKPTGISQISFFVNKVFTANENDQRQLSLAFGGIKVSLTSAKNIYKMIDFGLETV